MHAAAIPYLAAASVLQLAYIALLVEAYRRADMSVVYPLARGTAPVLVLLVSLVALGASASPARRPSGWRRSAAACCWCAASGPRLSDLRGVLLSLAVAACIAGYTLTDKYGIRHASALAYVELEMVLPTARVRRGRLPACAAGRACAASPPSRTRGGHRACSSATRSCCWP